MAQETLARMFWSRVEESSSRPAQQFKRDGRWHTLTWRQAGDIVEELALGLLALGRQKGDAVALLSASRVEWVHADMAILSAGCITVPIYPSYPPELIAYVVNDSQARTLIVEDSGQLAKALEARSKMEHLEQIVVISGYEPAQPPETVLTWEMLRRLGRDRREALKSTLAERVDSTTADDVATIVYTSGTTGPPKGVVQTHGNHVAALTAGAKTTPTRAEWTHLLFLPLAHSFARFESFLGPHQALVTAFAENLDQVGDNLKEVQPHFICSVPRVYEKVYAKILAGVEAGSPIKKRIFHWAVDVGTTVSHRQPQGQPIPSSVAVQHRLAHKLVFSKLHAALGGRLEWAVSGGAPLSRDIAEFFHAAGILILEGYGLTETCPALTANRYDQYKFGTVGTALPGVELRPAPDGEILARGPNIAKGYYKRPEATAEVFLEDGWFATGDIGEIDHDGFLRITDRKKDLIVTAGGKNIAPQNLENLLKADPYISQALVYGDRRPYLTAVLTLDLEATRRYADAHGIPGETSRELAAQPQIQQLLEARVAYLNQQLQSYAKIKKFLVLPEDFTVENGALTPTLKVKRRVISDRHRAALDSLYG